jgi:hypothetical protein
VLARVVSLALLIMLSTAAMLVEVCSDCVGGEEPHQLACELPVVEHVHLLTLALRGLPLLPLRLTLLAVARLPRVAGALSVLVGEAAGRDARLELRLVLVGVELLPAVLVGLFLGGLGCGGEKKLSFFVVGVDSAGDRCGGVTALSLRVVVVGVMGWGVGMAESGVLAALDARLICC